MTKRTHLFVHGFVSRLESRSQLHDEIIVGINFEKKTKRRSHKSSPAHEVCMVPLCSTRPVSNTERSIFFSLRFMNLFFCWTPIFFHAFCGSMSCLFGKISAPPSTLSSNTFLSLSSPPQSNPKSCHSYHSIVFLHNFFLRLITMSRELRSHAMTFLLGTF